MAEDSTNHNSSISKLSRLSRPRFHRRLPTIAAVGVLIIGLIVTLVIVQLERRHLQTEDQQHFQQLVDRVQADVIRRFTMYRYGLMGTRSVFAASNYVDRDDFIDIVTASDFEGEFPGALGIGYIDRVSSEPAAFDAYVQSVREEGAPWFEISVPPGAAPLPDAATNDRYIIKYIEPLAANRAAHGLDIGAHPVRREAAERAALLDEAALTGTIQLVQDDLKVAGFLYMLPYYKPGMPTETPEQRIEALLGWTYMPMLGPMVFDGIMSVANNELDVEVFGGETLSNELLIFDGDDHLSKINHATYAEGDYADREQHAKLPIMIGGRTWTLSLSTTPKFVKRSRAEVWTTGATGTVLSILFAILVYIQGSSSRKAWALAEGMTADLRDYASRAEQATAAKSDFLANMSHEIRTPMTAILGFTDLLRMQINQDNEELLSHTKTIKRNGEHLLSLINDILDMSKIEAGKLEIEQIALQPDAVVREVLSLMRVKADERKLPLSAQLLTPIPREILGDPVRLRQILVNLVGNAIKFTMHGGVSIEVRYDEAMEEIKFDVIDTGVGMTQEQVSRLFGAFEQADTTTTRQFGGTGLGLHISQRLATMLGGNICCSSKPGEGSTFTLTVYTSTVDTGNMIPAGSLEEVLSQSEVDKQGALPQVAAGNELKPLAGMKILLAEDGKDNQRLINFHLTKAGAEVTIAENGRIAVEELTVDGDISGPLQTPPPFDVLLTDMQMPEMDGYTEVRLLRKLGSTMPIVALTAHAMKEDVDKCLNAGCDYYASKPIDKQKLINICKEAASARAKAA